MRSNRESHCGCDSKRGCELRFGGLPPAEWAGAAAHDSAAGGHTLGLPAGADPSNGTAHAGAVAAAGLLPHQAQATGRPICGLRLE